MKLKNTTYVLKYDKDKNLHHYIEKDLKSNIKAFYSFNYKNNSLVKYDSINKIRIFNQFDGSCKLVHRFEAGESWIKAVLFDSSPHNLTYPKVRKQFALNSENQIVKFSIHQQLLEQWR